MFEKECALLSKCRDRRYSFVFYKYIHMVHKNTYCHEEDQEDACKGYIGGRESCSHRLFICT